MESDDSADIPLSVVQNRAANHHPSEHLIQPPDEPSKDDDDIPLSTHLHTFSRLKKRRDPKPVIHPPSDSDDDIPLASKLKKPQKPTSRPPAAHRKTSSPKRESDINPKPKKAVKRAQRVKKDEDAPIRKFEKLGQRRETPPENDPTRLFYQSMYHEKVALGKKSFTAESWMLRNGLLDDREAESVMARWDLKK